MNSLYHDIELAHHALRPQVISTPITFSMGLSKITGCKVYLKCEHLMTTGSFKFRGACNKIRLLSKDARKDGVLVASSGNHGQAVALAGSMAGVPVTVYASEQAAAVKLNAIAQYGAKLITLNAAGLEVELEARFQAEKQGKVFISPYNDLEVIAGQGTIGMELSEQCPAADAIFASVGGGGLISGIATAIKEQHPETRIIGCWPANATSLYTSLQSGSIISVEEFDTLSDGTAGEVEPGSVTFPICQKLLDNTVLVTEEEIKNAMKVIAQTDQWMIEGAAGVALAAMLKQAENYQGQKVVVVICGRNITLEQYLKAIA